MGGNRELSLVGEMRKCVDMNKWRGLDQGGVSSHAQPMFSLKRHSKHLCCRRLTACSLRNPATIGIRLNAMSSISRDNQSRPKVRFVAFRILRLEYGFIDLTRSLSDCLALLRILLFSIAPGPCKPRSSRSRSRGSYLISSSILSNPYTPVLRIHHLTATMPGRPRQDQGSSGLITNHISANARTPCTKSTAANPSTMPTRVRFIPAQRDAHAGSTTKALRESPAFGLIRDTRVLMGMLHYMPLIVFPFWTTDQSAELYPWSWLNIRDAVLQSLLAIIQALMIPLALVAILFSPVAPGALLVAMIAVPCAIVYLIALPMHGPRIVSEQPKMDLNSHPDERWLFINGCLTGYYNLIPVHELQSNISLRHVGLQQNVNRLSKTFGRPVTGIHNQR